MDFITKEDYYSRITSDILDQITNKEDTLLDNPEADAAALITDKIGFKYNVRGELGKTGAARNRSLVRWIVTISLYYLYGRIMGDDVPERIVKDYNDVIAELNKISGTGSCELERLTNATTGQPETNISFVQGNTDQYDAF